MSRLHALFVGFAVVLAASCSKHGGKSFSSYSEAKAFCDSAVKAADSSPLLDYTEFSGVPVAESEKIRAAFPVLFRNLKTKEFIRCDEVEQKSYAKYVEEQIALKPAVFQELSRMFPESKWNIEPERYLVYYFTDKSDRDTKINWTVGLFRRSGQWRIACNY